MRALAADSPLWSLNECNDQLILSAREFDRICNDEGAEDSASDEDETQIETEDGDDDSEYAISA
jgi:hypothetical protein